LLRDLQAARPDRGARRADPEGQREAPDAARGGRRSGPRRAVPRVPDRDGRRGDHAADGRPGGRAELARAVPAKHRKLPSGAEAQGLRPEARGDEPGDPAQDPRQGREQGEMIELDRRAARILVALSATGDTRCELEVYRYLFGDAPPEIVGLVLEDPALLAHAGSRLAREIVLSGVERRLDPQALERDLRARAAAWRRWLEAESARLGFQVALETVREERRAALARAAE